MALAEVEADLPYSHGYGSGFHLSHDLGPSRVSFLTRTRGVSLATVVNHPQEIGRGIVSPFLFPLLSGWGGNTVIVEPGVH